MSKMTQRVFEAMHPSEQVAYALANDGARDTKGRSTGCGLLTQTQLCNDWKTFLRAFKNSLPTR